MARELKRPTSFFDIDGTLVQGFSIISFARFLNDRKYFSSQAWGLMQSDLKSYAESSKDADSYRSFAQELVAHYAWGISGQDEREIVSLSEVFHDMASAGLIDNYMARSFAVGLVQLLKMYTRVVAISGSPLESVLPLRTYMGFDEIEATQLQIIHGVFTGEVVTNLALAESKQVVVNRYVADGVDLNRSFAFGDTQHDLPILEVVGNPFVVGDNAALISVGEERGWPTRNNDEELISKVKFRVAKLFGNKKY